MARLKIEREKEQTMRLAKLVKCWRRQARMLRARGFFTAAATKEACANDLEAFGISPSPRGDERRRNG